MRLVLDTDSVVTAMRSPGAPLPLVSKQGDCSEFFKASGLESGAARVRRIASRSRWLGHGAKFGRKKDEAIVALLSQRNVEDAARSAGIGTRTLLRWLQLPEFRSSYPEARRDAYSQAIARLQQASGAAVSTLLKVMVDVNAPVASRVRAADRVLGLAAKAIEVEDIEVRVSELELAAEASAPGRGERE